MAPQTLGQRGCPLDRTQWPRPIPTAASGSGSQGVDAETRVLSGVAGGLGALVGLVSPRLAGQPGRAQ